MITYPCPGCSADVPLAELACWDCWHRLPLEIQHALRATGGRRTVSGAIARFDAREWLRRNPSPYPKEWP